MIRFNSYNFGSRLGYGSGNSLYSSLSQLSTVKSGSYYRALRSYYGTNNRTNATQRNTAVNNKTYGVLGQDGGLTNVSKESKELSAAAKKLTDGGRNGLFVSEKTYDADAAYKAASDFVTNYNETLDAVNKSSNFSVSSTAGNMTRLTGVMSRGLSGVGISVGNDGKMSIDEESFKSAGFDKVNSMLGPRGSFSGAIDSTAQRLSSVAEQQNHQMSFSNGGLYDRSGLYSQNYRLTGSLFDGYF